MSELSSAFQYQFDSIREDKPFFDKQFFNKNMRDSDQNRMKTLFNNTPWYIPFDLLEESDNSPELGDGTSIEFKDEDLSGNLLWFKFGNSKFSYNLFTTAWKYYMKSKYYDEFDIIQTCVYLYIEGPVSGLDKRRIV